MKHFVLLKKKFGISSFLLFLVIIFALFTLFRSMAIYFLITIFSAVFVYINYYIKLPFDISPVLFLSLIFAREYGFLPSAAFILLSGIIPMVIAGGSFDHTTLFYLAIIFAASYISYLARLFDFVLAGLLLILLHHIAAFFGSISFGNSPHKELLNLCIKIGVDSFYILALSGFVIGMIR